MLVVSQATLGGGCGTCVVVVPCSRQMSSSVVPRHTSGGRAVSVKATSAAAAKASGAGGPGLWGLPQHGEDRETERGGASTSAAMLLKAPAPRKKRALEAPAAASGITGDVAESEAERAPALTCSGASVLWD